MGRGRINAATCAPALLMLLAAADAPLSAGAWEIRNTPGMATLDGEELSALPLGPIRTESICLSPAQALEPARFFARELDPGCTVTSASIDGGKVAIAGTCPNQVEGPDGAFTLSGRWESDRYDITFQTAVEGENGRMGFSGALSGHRVGSCEAD